MGRALLHLLPLLVPFAAYALYVWLLRRSAARSRSPTPWLMLTASGLVLSIVSLVLLGLLGGDEPGGRYQPARLENGTVVPGETR